MLHYFDNAATTPVRPEAVQAAVEAMTQGWGNPSSQYALGRQAAGRVKGWRADTAAALGCRPEEVFFTSCGSESDNWAIRGALELNRRQGKHIVTTAIEHAAVLEPLKALERQGYEVTCLQPDRWGELDPAQLSAALRPDTVLVSMMLVNNELGTVLPVKEAARAIRAAGCPALLHCDAVQGFLKVPFTPKELGVDLLSVSGHKIHAPKGVGALYVRSGLKLPPLIRGGGQEGGLRSGTEATA
ncbi:MAG: cysteine desulfurase, partial [Lawsonibacter sp.]|nr:cysteine desulfurase [Lawsonibacter sp.]